MAALAMTVSRTEHDHTPLVVPYHRSFSHGPKYESTIQYLERSRSLWPHSHWHNPMHALLVRRRRHAAIAVIRSRNSIQLGRLLSLGRYGIFLSQRPPLEHGYKELILAGRCLHPVDPHPDRVPQRSRKVLCICIAHRRRRKSTGEQSCRQGKVPQVLI